MNGENWETARLSTVLEKIIDYRGKAPPKAESGIRLITARNVRFGHLDLSHAEFIDEDKYEAWMNRGRPCGTDVLFTTEAPLANACMYPADGKFAVGQRIITLRPDSAKLDSNYLLNFLLSPFGQGLIHKRSSGTTAKGIKSKEFAKIEMPLPPLNEQRQVGTMLATWDRAIETVEALIANARAQKEALMQQLLSGERRLPGFSEPWDWGAFADVFDRVKTKNAEGNTNVLTISAQLGLISQVEYFNKTVASDDVRGYTLLQRGDFAYNKSYSDGYPMGAIKPLDRYDNGIVSSLYICFRLTKRGFDHDFFRHYFEAGFFNREIAAIAQEGARNHGLLNVSVVEFFETSLHIPKPDEQVAIAEVINAAEAEEQAYETQLSALRQEKAALMQQLLTGKRRVKLPESEVADA